MIDEVLNEVSKNCLKGQAVPGSLRALWEAQSSDQSPIAEIPFRAVELVSNYDDGFFHGYEADFIGDAAVARAYTRMFEQIAFIGREEEGGLIGYWLHGEDITVDRAPIVVLDNEGQFRCTALTLQDHFVQTPYDDPESVAAIRRWFESRGFETGETPEAVWDAMTKEKLPDPNKLSWRFQHEENAS